MRKLFFAFVSCILFSTSVFAKTNVFCNNQETSDPDCMKGGYVMYLGFLNGYMKAMTKYNKESNQKTDEKTEMKRIMKLVPYETFYEFFQDCGENKKDMGSAQACVLSRLQDLIVTKLEKESES